MKKIAITTGDPNGIGAEITIKALNKMNLDENKIVLISNEKVLNFYGKLNKNYEIIKIPYEEENIKVGKITKEAGEFSFQSLKKVCEIKPLAIVTAPVAKKRCTWQDIFLTVKQKFCNTIWQKRINLPKCYLSQTISEFCF